MRRVALALKISRCGEAERGHYKTGERAVTLRRSESIVNPEKKMRDDALLMLSAFSCAQLASLSGMISASFRG